MDRVQIANFVSALVFVYSAMIFAYIIVSFLPLPYNRTTSSIREFLEQTVRPYLNLFRRFIPNVGPFDFSPMVGLILLQIAGRVVHSAIVG